MADKPQARGMPIPSGMTVQPEGSSEDSVAMQPEIQDKMVDPTKDEEVQIDQVLGNLMDFIWDDGYEAIVEKLNQSPPMNFLSQLERLPEECWLERLTPQSLEA